MSRLYKLGAYRIGWGPCSWEGFKRLCSVRRLTLSKQRKGLNILADVAKLGLAFQYTGVATSRKFARGQPDIVRRYVRSQVEAVHRIYTDKQTSLQVLRKYFRGNVEPDLLEKTWELLTERAMFPNNQY